MLTFTLAFRIIKLGSDSTDTVTAAYITELLFAALGATLAWGVIDGVMYALIEVFQRSERHRLLQQVKDAATEEDGVAVIADEFDYILEPITGEAERQVLYRSMLGYLRHSRPRPVGFQREDLAGALGCVLVAVLAVLPSLAALALLRDNPAVAIRASNVVSFIVLFIAGYQWGQHTGANPWRTGLLLFIVGLLMVAIAIPLGG